MKNLSLALNAVLLVAVLILYVLHFTDRPAAPIAAAPADTSAAVSPNELDQLRAALPTVVFVNTDTLLGEYEFFKTSKASLEARGRRLEKDLASRQRTLENELADAQRRAQAGTLTQQEGMELEQRLMQKQQEFLAYREKASQEILEQEQGLNEQLNRNITEFLSDWGRTQDYTYVLGYSPGNGTVLFAHDTLDVTRRVLQGLNEQYAAGKKTP
ncbi:MAG: OmpH family outer membrane protein [Catalinimonas sp.]